MSQVGPADVKVTFSGAERPEACELRKKIPADLLSG
jgi:hypothetical protein